MICVYLLGVSVCYLSAGLSGSIKRMTGGADRVSVAKTPPCSWIPKPVSGSPLRMTSLVSTWKTCPPGPTELDARDTEPQRGEREGTHQRETERNQRDMADKWSKRATVRDNKWRSVRRRDMPPQRWHEGRGMRVTNQHFRHSCVRLVMAVNLFSQRGAGGGKEKDLNLCWYLSLHLVYVTVLWSVHLPKYAKVGFIHNHEDQTIKWFKNTNKTHENKILFSSGLVQKFTRLLNGYWYFHYWHAQNIINDS